MSDLYYAQYITTDFCLSREPIKISASVSFKSELENRARGTFNLRISALHFFFPELKETLLMVFLSNKNRQYV